MVAAATGRYEGMQKRGTARRLQPGSYQPLFYFEKRKRDTYR